MLSVVSNILKENYVTMRVLVVLGHERADSLNGLLYSEIITHLQHLGCETISLELYKYLKTIPLAITNKEMLESNDFFIMHKQLFMRADAIVLVFPIYWYSMPALLKAWLDCITNFAYVYDGGSYARPLHSINRVFVVQTSNAKTLKERFLNSWPLYVKLKATFRWLGITKLRLYHMSPCYKLSQNFIDQHFKKIKKRLTVFMKKP